MDVRITGVQNRDSVYLFQLPPILASWLTIDESYRTEG